LTTPVKIGYIWPILKCKKFISCSMAKHVGHRRDQDAINIMAKNVRKYRKEKKLTMQALANIADLDYAQIGRIERGVANSTISTIFNIAAALDINPVQLIES
jgi:DNA-binding XRE family transcriptional regulator